MKTLIGPQRLALPFRRLAFRSGQPGPRHRDHRSARTCPSASASGCHDGARDAGSCFIAGHLASFVTGRASAGIELAADQLFDELTRPSPYLGLDRVETSCRKGQQPFRSLAAKNQASWYCSSWRGLQSDASTPDDSRLNTPETTPTSIPTNSATAPAVGDCASQAKIYGPACADTFHSPIAETTAAIVRLLIPSRRRLIGLPAASSLLPCFEFASPQTNQTCSSSTSYLIRCSTLFNIKIGQNFLTLPSWAKRRNTRREQLVVRCSPTTDMKRRRQHVRFVPNLEVAPSRVARRKAARRRLSIQIR